MKKFFISRKHTVLLREIINTWLFLILKRVMSVFFIISHGETFHTSLSGRDTTLKRRCNNINWMLETLYGRCEDVVCRLGRKNLSLSLLQLSRYTTLKKRHYNVIWTLKTLYERCKNVVCQLRRQKALERFVELPVNNLESTL